MMRNALVILAICALALSGCGTFADTMCGPINDHAFYRGVQLDVEAVKEGGSMALMAADIPLSAAADTLLAPYIAYRQFTDPPCKSPLSTADEQANGTKCGGASLPQSTPKQ